MRLDKFLVEKKLVVSREKAQELIKSGFVFLDEKVLNKPAFDLNETDFDKILIQENPFRFVSRGGNKLFEALKEFRWDFNGRVGLDLGAATGGFTDCLLQSGFSKVVAVDIGEGQLHEVLLKDKRVEFIKDTDVRDLDKVKFACKFDLVVVDLSFISLAKVLPLFKCIELNVDGFGFLCLIKPQFEMGLKLKRDLNSISFQKKVLKFLQNEIESHDFKIRKIFPSKVKGKEGTQEFWVWFS